MVRLDRDGNRSNAGGRGADELLLSTRRAVPHRYRPVRQRFAVEPVGDVDFVETFDEAIAQADRGLDEPFGQVVSRRGSKVIEQSLDIRFRRVAVPTRLDNVIYLSLGLSGHVVSAEVKGRADLLTSVPLVNRRSRQVPFTGKRQGFMYRLDFQRFAAASNPALHGSLIVVWRKARVPSSLPVVEIICSVVKMSSYGFVVDCSDDAAGKAPSAAIAKSSFCK